MNMKFKEITQILFQTLFQILFTQKLFKYGATIQ